MLLVTTTRLLLSLLRLALRFLLQRLFLRRLLWRWPAIG